MVILIPVFNAFEDLKKCLDSVSRHTDLENNSIIFIEDVSTDERVLPFLVDWCGAHKNATLIENTENKGFPANINTGFAHSAPHDVIILNTDTVVTENWVEKLTRCAATRSNTATVTPLSNNATLCSVPTQNTNNEIPKGHTIDGFAKLVEECSLQKYPEIPVGVGFCMLITREAINAVGGFDEETYGLGYGEEEDFCYKAEQLGFVNIMCDDTYIVHSGSSSFISKTKQELIRRNSKILSKKYPQQVQAKDDYLLTEINRIIQDNIALHLSTNNIMSNGKKNILFVTHYDFSDGAMHSRGGVQLHIKDLTDALKNQYNIFVTCRDYNSMRVRIYSDGCECSLDYPAKKHPIFPRYTDVEVNAFFTEVLDVFRIDILHIHSTFRQSFDIFEQAKKRKIPYVVTLHDYYFICPNIQLLDADNNVCTGIATNEGCRQTVCAL